MKPGFTEPADFGKYQIGFGVFFQDPLAFTFRLCKYKFIWRHLKETDNVLELACGDGLGSYMLATKAQSVLGTDISPSFIDYANQYFKRDNLSFQALDALNGAFNTKYDVAVLCGLLEYFTDEQTDLVMRNVLNALTPEGIAFVGTTSKASYPYASERRKATHLKEYMGNELAAMLSKFFHRVDVFTVNDEVIALTFPNLSYNLMAKCSYPKREA